MRRNAWLVAVGVVVLVALLAGRERAGRRSPARPPTPTPAAAPAFAAPPAAPGPRPGPAPPAPAPADAAPLVGVALVRGRVVTFDGRAAGGDVAWRPGDETPLTDGVAGGIELDASGRFEVQFPAAPIVLVAMTDDEEVAAERLSLADGEERDVVLTVRRPDTSPITVRLADPAGEPIAAAEIQADPEPGAGDATRAWFLYRRWGRTGADGVARLALPAGRYRFWHRASPGDALADPAADARLPPSARATVGVDRDHATVELVERDLPVVHCTLVDAGGARVRPRVRQVTRLDDPPSPPAPDPDDDPDVTVEIPRVARSIPGPPADVLHLAWTAPLIVTLGAGDHRADVTLATPRDRCEVHLADDPR